MRPPILFVLAIASLAAGPADASLRVVAEPRPFALLHSPNLDGLAARLPVGPFAPTRTETVSHTWSALPSLRAGVGFDQADVSCDLTVGVGKLWNQAFDATVTTAGGSVRFRIGGPWLLGVHLELARITSPSWQGDSAIHLSSTTGTISGLTLQTDGRASFTLAVDYLRASLDVEGRGGWVPSRSTLDLSGPSVSVGFAWRF